MIDETLSHRLCDGIKEGCINLQSINLTNNNLGPQGIYALTGAIYYCPGLTKLSIAHNFIRDEGCQTMCEYLSLKSCPLLELDMADNFITEQSARYLLGMLDYYELSDYMQDEDILRNGSLTLLDLSRNDICTMKRDLRLAEQRRGFKLRILSENLR